MNGSNMSRSLQHLLPAISLVLALGMPAANATLTFNFTPVDGTSQAAIDGFAAAGNRWSSLFHDNITINLQIGFSDLGASTLGGANPSFGTVSYFGTTTAMAFDATTATDVSAVSSLQPDSAFDLLMNLTTDNPNGSGSAVPYLDDDGSLNNSNILMTFANAKALGLLDPFNSGIFDATINFNSTKSWDFDPSDGVTAGAFDFIGIATHEIGHALGFVSGVDLLLSNQPWAEDNYPLVTPLDLFRFSADSFALGVHDFTADNRDKYFSIDGGSTSLGTFSEGIVGTSTRQASHWEDNLSLGIMDPTAATGETLAFTPLDLIAFDAIGYDLTSVPEPAHVLGPMALTIPFVRRWRNRRRSQKVA